MIKSELITRIADVNHHLFHKDIERIVNVVLDEIIDALARGDRVELRGFGAFTVKHREPRTGRNPRTGAAVTVDEKFVPFFKSGRELRDRLNQSAGHTVGGRAKAGKADKADKADAAVAAKKPGRPKAAAKAAKVGK